VNKCIKRDERLGAANMVFPVVKASLLYSIFYRSSFFMGASPQTPGLTTFEGYNN
jgi:hypothetical protein